MNEGIKAFTEENERAFTKEELEKSDQSEESMVEKPHKHEQNMVKSGLKLLIQKNHNRLLKAATLLAKSYVLFKSQ